jgi:hypothetical protein
VDPDLRVSRVNQARREALANSAVELAQRVRFVEARSIKSESSISTSGLGIKLTSGIDLNQVPLTEPDLVLELATFVKRLHGGGYRLRIGIDELDKLVIGDAAERFLTGIKSLFPIRECTFLLTISENAAADFARRGMPVRNVFDSSLDSVVTVEPLTFHEARRLVRGRLTGERTEDISDSQVLLCHCLSGGLPREFLRFCRLLGETNSRIEGQGSLQRVLEPLLNSELRVRLDGVRLALQSRDGGEAAGVLVAELELIEGAVSGGTAIEVLEQFLQADVGFAGLCDATSLRQETPSEMNSNELRWIRDTRRQLYSYVLFAETVRGSFGRTSLLGEKVGGTDDIILAFVVLTDGRRRLEIDAASGWRRISEARCLLGLPAVRPEMIRGGAGSIVRRVRRALRDRRVVK